MWRPLTITEVRVADMKNPVDVWELLFVQTPTVIRWFLGVLVMSVLAMVTALYRWNRKDLQRIADRQVLETDRVHHRIDRLELKLDQSMAEMNNHLLEIARNTRKDN